MNAQQRWETETRLRASGFPYLVTARGRARELVPRMAPLLAGVAAFGTTDLTVELIPDDTGTFASSLLALALLAVLLLAVPIGAFAVTAWLLRIRRRQLWWLGWALLAYFLLLDPLYVGEQLFGPANAGLPAAYLANAVIIVLLALATWAGLGSLLGWSVVAALRQLSAFGQLTSRALPLVLLVVVFSFYAPEIWQLTDALPAGRLGLVALFFVALGMFSVSRVARRELSELYATAAGPPLARLERANLAFVLMLAQGFQVVVFGLVAFVFLVVLGELSIAPGVLQAWTGHAATPITVLDIPLPVDVAIAKTAFFLASIAALNFVISVATDASYRDAFYDPLLQQVREGLTVRAEYRSSAR